MSDESELEVVVTVSDLNGTPIDECEVRPSVTITETAYFNAEGHLHRLSGPAVTRVRSDHPDLISSYWYEEGIPHRIEGPAASYYEFDADGIRHITEFKRNDNRYREGGPAYIERDHETGVLLELRWCLGKGFHRPQSTPDDPQKPAFVSFDRQTGLPTKIEYYVNRELHRPEEQGPARILKDGITGFPERAEFYRNGLLHRETGPAYLEYDPLTGELTAYAHSLEGVPYTKPEDPSLGQSLTNDFRS